jgi:hypothetical protein
MNLGSVFTYIFWVNEIKNILLKLPCHSPERTAAYHQKIQSAYTVSLLIFKLGAPKARIRNAKTLIHKCFPTEDGIVISVCHTFSSYLQMDVWSSWLLI